jgi:hypothetical protein
MLLTILAGLQEQAREIVVVKGVGTREGLKFTPSAAENFLSFPSMQLFSRAPHAGPVSKCTR